MPDEIDRIVDREEEILDKQLAVAREAWSFVRAGEPGECLECGEVVLRVVGGRCAPCRERVNAARLIRGEELVP